MPDENGIFRVYESNKEQLDYRIARLNKRARKLGCPEIKLIEHGTEDEPVYEKDIDGETRFVGGRPAIKCYRRILLITVEGSAPKIAGWEFIAVIEPTVDEEGKVLGNILRGVPGATKQVPEKYRTAGNNCDHCQKERRRLETFVLANDAGDFKQVGRNCLRDFLGHTNPEAYCSYAEMLMSAAELCAGSEDEDFFGDGGARHEYRFDAEEILQLAACSVRLTGWRSNATARQYGTESTSDQVKAWIFTRPDHRKDWKFPLHPIDEDKATAKEVADWLETLQTRTDLNDYMYNLSILGQGAMFTTKNFGLACSAIPTYLREKEREINRKKRFEDDKNSQYCGTVGKRERFELTLVYERDFESTFGVMHMLKFRDANSNVFIWFASNKYCAIGETVVVNATVKAHEEYEGVKQTIITRCTEWKSKEQKKAEAAARKAERKAQAEQQSQEYPSSVSGEVLPVEAHIYQPQEHPEQVAEHGDVIAQALYDGGSL